VFQYFTTQGGWSPVSHWVYIGFVVEKVKSGTGRGFSQITSVSLHQLSFRHPRVG